MGDSDPVASVLGDEEDLYDVAEWDARTALDRFSTSLHGGLHASKRFVLILLAVVLFVVQLAFAGILIARDFRLGLLALLSAVPAFALVAWVWWDDPTRREPLDNLAVTFILSILFASFAAAVNGVFQAVFGLVPVVGTVLFFFLVVGPIEETVKWLSIRVYAYNSDRFNAVIDGVVYGAVAGLGFATIENALYIVQGSVDTVNAGSTAQIDLAVGTALGRALVGPGHVLYSAFAGYYLGLAKFNPDDRGPIVVKGLLIAAVIHASYNTLVTYLPEVLPTWNLFTFLGFVLVFDLIVGYALYRKVSRYTSYYRRATERSPGEDSVAPVEDEAASEDA